MVLCVDAGPAVEEACVEVPRGCGTLSVVALWIFPWLPMMFARISCTAWMAPCPFLDLFGLGVWLVLLLVVVSYRCGFGCLCVPLSICGFVLC